ncbi:PREDICTED: uncharacterized protein LOC107190513 [Dufourea novaeangliae]|uniref:Selenocysteine insertion sequence-binding protein 2-like n=1 Tax=Dufourea novaeangliae TaxID=178035 RepID=A0A154PL21_DUFNO|nr:PREDICTED: uncharacterized protein LOC107190513 [Dufourea novaeangliae]KZC12447.1 Selenocysteine insertion sequence-binding protein 2-like [Dufourea novaeangliae]
MLNSQVVNLTWSLQKKNGNLNDLWPELCQTNQVKHSAHRKELTNTEENNRTISLDNVEYPELGSAIVKNKNSVAMNRYISPNPTITVLVPELNLAPKKLKNMRRFKRAEKIYINLEEESTKFAYKINNKELPKFRINISKGNTDITNAIDRNSSSNLRKIKVPISKDTKPSSKLKRAILFSRDMKVQINVQKREAFEQAKMQAICKDVDAINFNALKITSDPEMDYVKRMCTMTLYSKDYRQRNAQNISDNSVCYRPDIIDKINTLHIQRKSILNTLTGNSSSYNPFQFNNSTVENDIAQKTRSLQIKDDIKEEIKQEIKEEPEDIIELDVSNSLIYSRNFREYCTNMLTPGLRDSLETFMREITRLQRRFYEKNPNKSKYKRRYYSGLKEVCKHGEYKKLVFVIIAPDLEKVELEGGLDDQVSKLLDMCRRQNVVSCFGLSRRKLGYYTHGTGFVGCVGITNYSGTEELFKNVLIELTDARNTFKKLSGVTDAFIDISKSISEDHLLSENIGALLKILSPISIHC